MCNLHLCFVLLVILVKDALLFLKPDVSRKHVGQSVEEEPGLLFGRPYV
jgi:hypothetical protein